MERSELEAYCLSKRGAVKDFPFDAVTAVYKVMGKMFALMPSDGAVTINLKCDPTRAVMLRDTYPAITGAWHMNKTHWNTLKMDGTIPPDEIEELIDHSYDLVVKGLTKQQRATLASSA